VDLVWNTFDQRYPGFAATGVDWDAIREEFVARADTVQSRPSMISLLTEMLGHLQSRNVVLFSGGQIETFEPDIEPNCDMDVLWSYLEPAGFQWIDEGVWGACMFDSIPYVLLLSWDQGIGIGDLDSLLELYADAPALIIDIRMNGDLSGTVGIFPNSLPKRFAGRFNAVERLGCFAAIRSGPEHGDLNLVPQLLQHFPNPWEKPVILLTGEGSAWLTELFVCLASEIPTVTVVGDTTQGQVDGTYSLEEWFALPGGESYRLPYSTIILADSVTEVQCSGLAPDVAVSATVEDFAQGIDPVLDYALGLAAGAR
jgi:hypothetical protein